MKPLGWKDGKVNWPANPRLWQRFTYLDGISGCTYITYEWCGVAGWRFVERA